MNFGERLTQLRKDNGYLKRNAFAEVLGIPETTLRNYETNVREPGHKFLLRISELFNVSVDFLLCATDDMEKVGSYQLKSSEYEHIKKYRTLDQHGKKMVDMVLTEEHARQAAEQAKADTIQETTPEHLILNAAHAIEGTSPEDIQHDEDIMDDENF